MALQFVDSFDHYTTAQITRKWNVDLGGSGQIVVGGGRNGTNGLHGGALRKTGVGGATTILGVAMTIVRGSGSFGNIFRPQTAGVAHSVLTLNADLTLSVVNFNGTVLGTSAASLLEAAYAYIEFKLGLAGGSSGTYDVHLDGVSILSGTGVTTNPNVAASVNSVVLGGQAGATLNCVFDDFYVADGTGAVNNNFLGDVMVQPLYPAGAGATTQWTPSSGANWQNVAEHSPDDDGSYNKSGTPAQVDLYALDQITGSAPTIFGVQWNAMMRKNDASSYILNRAIRSGTTTFLGAPLLTPNTTYRNFTEVIELNPNTASAWTKTTVNALQAGQKLVSVV